jgi:hypothetical protein
LKLNHGVLSIKRGQAAEITSMLELKCVFSFAELFVC